MPGTDRAFVRRVAIAVALVGLAALIVYTARILLLAFAAVLGAVILDMIAEWVKDRIGLSLRASYWVVLLSLIAMVAATGWLLVPRVVIQLQQLRTAFPGGIAKIQQWLQGSEAGKVVESHMTPLINTFAAKAGNLGLSILDGAVLLAIAVILSAYLAATPREYKRGFLSLVPTSERRKTEVLGRELKQTMGRWVLGQLVPMTVLGIVTMVGLLLLGIPLVFTLSLFTGVMIFIP